MTRLGPTALSTEPLQGRADRLAPKAQRHDVIRDRRGTDAACPAVRLFCDCLKSQCSMLRAVPSVCRRQDSRPGPAPAVNWAGLEVRTAGTTGATDRAGHYRGS